MFPPALYLPLAASDGRVDVLLQQLLGLHFMDAEPLQQLSDLLALQRLHAAQQIREHNVYISVQGWESSWENQIIKKKQWQKNWVSNIPNCNLKYSLGNAAVFCKSAKCHRFVFLQVLPFCSIIYDGKHGICFDSLFWFLLGELAQISSDPLSWLGEPPHWSLHRWIFQRNTVTISAVSLTHLCPLHFISERIPRSVPHKSRSDYTQWPEKPACFRDLRHTNSIPAKFHFILLLSRVVHADDAARIFRLYFW